MTEAVLALDIGTSSVRTALFDRRGRRLPGSEAQAATTLLTDGTGRAELAPAGLLGAVRRCLDTTHDWLVKDARDTRVIAMGTSCFWHSLLGTDARDRPLTPVITWADTRPAAEAERLRTEFDEHDYHARTGCMLHASFWPARLRWLARADRAAFRRVERWLSPGEWVLTRLFGLRACAHGMAGATGLYGVSTLDFDDELLALVGLSREQLGPLDEAGHLPSRAAIRRWPGFAEARIHPAIGDGAAGNLGSGTGDGETLALNYGTSAAIRQVRTGTPRRTPFGLFAYRIDAKRYVTGGATSNAGIARQWAERTFALPLGGEALDREMLRRTPGAHGLAVLPFLNGERAPYWRDDLTGIVSGLRTATTPLDIVTALTEASHHRLALIADALPGARRRVAIVSGGLGRSRAGMQLLADVTGLTLRPSSEPEASLRGAAVLALERSGIKVPSPRLGRLVEPNAERSRAYRRARRDHVALEARFDA